jgi:hypothetical protein
MWQYKIATKKEIFDPHARQIRFRMEPHTVTGHKLVLFLHKLSLSPPPLANSAPILRLCRSQALSTARTPQFILLVARSKTW